MALAPDVRDGFESYYTEKLWQLIPEVYRNEDGLADEPGVLRQIVEIIASDAAEARRSIDRLWEDQHIETCDDWAVPYIGALVGTRLVSIADRRARRVDVASTIRYRRRRGTPGLLKELVRSFSGWDVVLAEGFQRIARLHHRLSPFPVARGLFTATLPGGTADLRNSAGAELAESPFGEFYHTVDTRRLTGRDGQFGIRKLNFHLYRHRAYVIEGSDLVELSDGGSVLRQFVIDPSGRDVPLFIDAEAPEEFCGPTREWDVTQPMRCRLLGHVAYVILASHLSELATLPAPPLAVDLDAMRQALRTRFASESALRRRLVEFGAVIPAVPPAWYRRLVERALTVDTGKAQLYPRQVQVALSGAPLGTAEVRSGDLSNRECQPQPAGHLERVLISPEIGRLAAIPPGASSDEAPQIIRYVYGFSGDVGAGPYPRTLGASPALTASGGVIPLGGVLQGDGLTLDDNRSYDLTIRSDVAIDGAQLLVRSGRRPLVRLHGDPGNPNGANLIATSEGQTFVADGGWYVSSAANATPGAVADFVIEGLGGADTAIFDFDRLELSHLTLDPGGVRADATRIAPLRLFIRGQIRTLIVKRSIVGPIVVAPVATDPLARVEKLLVCDSIVDANQVADGAAIVNALGQVVLEGSTVFGNVVAGVLWASTSIITGTVQVANNQSGCLRFSASSPGPGERLPPRYRDVHVPIAAAFFNSMRFGSPEYAQLSIVAPQSITRGAENGSEMGAFSHLLSPIRSNSIRAKVDEFGPVGVLAQFLFEEGRVAGPELAGPLDIPPEVLPVPAATTPGDVIAPGPPPPVAPLPTACPDDRTTPDEDPRILLIDVEGADLGGAPTYWRESNWTGEVQWPGGSARFARGIPFDRVEHWVEFDARLVRSPIESAFRRFGAGGEPSLFEIELGTLRFAVASGQSAGFYQVVSENFGSPTPPLHAYATLRMDDGTASGASIASGASSNQPLVSGAGFGVGIVRTTAQGNLGLVTRVDGRMLDPSGLVNKPMESGSAELRLQGTHWTRVALDADFDRNVGIVSQDDRIERADLGATPPETGVDGSWPPSVALPGARSPTTAAMAAHHVTVPATHERGPRVVADPLVKQARLWAFFGVNRPGLFVSGEIQNFVASSPGRFIRAWFATRSPWAKPRLRLRFSGDLEGDGHVQLLVRYGARTVGSPALEYPRTELKVPLKMSRGAGESEVELSRVTAEEHLWLTVERSSLHSDDNYAATARLLELALLGTPVEVP